MLTVVVLMVKLFTKHTMNAVRRDGEMEREERERGRERVSGLKRGRCKGEGWDGND